MIDFVPEQQINITDNKGKTGLHYSASSGEHTVLASLLRIEGIIATAKDNLGKMPLHYAAECKHLSCVIALLPEMDNIGIVDNHRKSPLHYAAASGNEEMVEILLQKDPTIINFIDCHGKTAVRYAMEKNHWSISKRLLRAKAVPDLPATPSKSWLHLAARAGQIDIINERKDEIHELINLQDKKGRTPLHHASKKGHDAVIILLLDMRARANIRDKHGMLPLHLAALKCSPESVDKLVTKIVHGKLLKDNSGKLGLHYSAQTASLNKNELLYKSPEFIGFRDDTGKTPLHYAAARGQFVAIKFLVEALPADQKKTLINARDGEGKTPLHYAAKNEDYKSASFLLEHNAESIMIDCEGKYPHDFVKHNNKLKQLLGGNVQQTVMPRVEALKLPTETIASKQPGFFFDKKKRKDKKDKTNTDSQASSQSAPQGKSPGL